MISKLNLHPCFIVYVLYSRLYCLFSVLQVVLFMICPPGDIFYDLYSRLGCIVYDLYSRLYFLLSVLQDLLFIFCTPGCTVYHNLYARLYC